MLIILPPSETKAHDGHGQPLNLDRLSFSTLNPIRERIIDDLIHLPVDKAMTLLKLTPRLQAEAESNQHLLISPTMPAIKRYTGVLYDALQADTLSPAALSHIGIGDALFGLLMSHDMIPHYRLSGNTKLPHRHPDNTAAPTMKKRWGNAISTLKLDHELILDLRSGIYQQLGPLPHALTLRVETEQANGTRKIVSHFNKHYKGVLARILATEPHNIRTRTDIIDCAAAHNLHIEDHSTPSLTLVISTT